MFSFLPLLVLATFVSSANAISADAINRMTTAHGTLASIAFLVFFPAGAFVMSLGKFPSVLKIHAAIQIFAYMIMIVVAGLGIRIAIYNAEFNEPHIRLGLVLFSILFFQAPTGYIHHLLFKRKHKRTVVSYWHLIIGRCAVILGMINGGLGIELSAPAYKYQIAYAVVAGVIGAAYIASIVYSEVVRYRAGPMSTPEGKTVDGDFDMTRTSEST